MVTANNELMAKGAPYFRMALNPFCPQDKKDEALRELMDGLTEMTFNQFAPQIISKLKFNRAKDYPDTKSEVDAYIKKFPRMEAYRDLITECCRDCRAKKHLTL